MLVVENIEMVNSDDENHAGAGHQGVTNGGGRLPKHRYNTDKEFVDVTQSSLPAISILPGEDRVTTVSLSPTRTGASMLTGKIGGTRNLAHANVRSGRDAPAIVPATRATIPPASSSAIPSRESSPARALITASLLEDVIAETLAERREKDVSNTKSAPKRSDTTSWKESPSRNPSSPSKKPLLASPQQIPANAGRFETATSWGDAPREPLSGRMREKTPRSPTMPHESSDLPESVLLPIPKRSRSVSEKKAASSHEPTDQSGDASLQVDQSNELLLEESGGQSGRSVVSRAIRTAVSRDFVLPETTNESESIADDHFVNSFVEEVAYVSNHHFKLFC